MFGLIREFSSMTFYIYNRWIFEKKKKLLKRRIFLRFSNNIHIAEEKLVNKKMFTLWKNYI